MKRFFPSHLMLIPFVVKNYSDEEPDDHTESTQPEPSDKELESPAVE